MAKKLDRVVGSNAGLLSTKSHNLLIKWSHSHITNEKRDKFNFTWLMIRSHMSNKKVTYPSDHVVT